MFYKQARETTPSHHCVAIVGKNTVVGESAALNDGRRKATVMAHSDVVALRLSYVDYHKILYQHQIMERQKRFEFLTNLPFFSSWDRVSLVDYNNVAEEIQMN